jgi:GDP-L-fucose synthase
MVGVSKLIFLGSSCVYPRMARQPMKEEDLLTGRLEPTNEPYSIAKIAGIKMCDAYRKQYGCDFISAMPANLYGPGDKYDASNGHVVAALIMKVHQAMTRGDSSITLWGTGTARREFLYVEDLADALIFMTKAYSEAGPINIGTGTDITIRQLAETIAEVIGWSGEIVYDSSKPDGMPRKVMDVSRLSSLGWTAKTDLTTGLKAAYESYVNQIGILTS